MAEKKCVYAWDAAVWIAWLRREEDKCLQRIGAVVRELVEGDAVLVISAICDVEVVDLDVNDKTFELYGLIKRLPYVQTINVHQRIVEKARKVRSLIRIENNSRKNNKLAIPKAADSIHLATAILAEASVLHTYDKGLLSLSGKQIVDGIRITEPRSLSGQILIEDPTLSLQGMTPEDALRKALGTKLPESVIKAEEEAERDEKKSQKKK